MALTTVTVIKTILGITGTAQDAQLAVLLDAADAAIKNYTKRDLEQVTYPGAAPNGKGDSGYYSGSGLPELVLRQYPVSSVVTVHCDQSGAWGQGPNAFASTTLLTAGTDYALELDRGGSISARGMLRRLGPWGWGGGPWGGGAYPYGGTLAAGRGGPGWSLGSGNIRVGYVAGYATIPGDIVQAVAQLTKFLQLNGPSGGMLLAQESLGQYSYQLAQVAIAQMPELGTTRQLLTRYRAIDL